MDLLSNTFMRELKKQNELLLNENLKLKTEMNLMKKMNQILINIKINLQNTIESIIQVNCDVIEMPEEFETNSMIVTKLSQELEEFKNQLDICLNQTSIDGLIENQIKANAENAIACELNPIVLDNNFVEVMSIEDKKRKKQSLAKSFSTKGSNLKKMKSTNSIKYTCDWPECGFSVTNDGLNCEEITDHMRTHTQKSFECAFPDCGKKFNKCWDLKKHVMTHENNSFSESEDQQLLKCCENDCSFESKDLQQFRQHLIAHNEEKTFICNHLGCDEKFATIDSLLEHSRTHRPPKKQKKFSCHYDDCNEKFDNFQQLYSHRSVHKASSSSANSNSLTNKIRNNSEKFMKMTTISGITYYTCIWIDCVYKSQIKFDVLRHIRTHTGERPYGCKYPGCGMRFKDSAHLATHKMIHTGEKPFKCSFCPYTTRSNSYLKKHHLTHKNGKRCTFPCSHCRLKFLTVNDLKEHNKTHHNNEVMINCGVDGCGLTFKLEKELEEHMQWHNTSEAKKQIEAKVPFVCNFEKCNKRFESEDKLAEHYFGHINTADRPYLCEYEECGKRFKNNEQLKIHKRTHTNERPYVCEYVDCGKRFKTGGQLTNHLRIHTGDKPYACDVEGCIRKFATKSQLIHHKKLHTVRSRGLVRRYTNYRNYQ